MPNWAKKLAEWVGLLVVIGGLVLSVGSMWIDGEVERRMKELAVTPVDPGDAPAVVANTTKIDGLVTGQARIEGKVDAFATQFTAYLEREASR